MQDNLASFCVNSGLVAQSMEEANRVFPRWRSRLRKLGIDTSDIPPHPLLGTTPAQVRAANLVTQLILQHRKSRAPGHGTRCAQRDRHSTTQTPSHQETTEGTLIPWLGLRLWLDPSLRLAGQSELQTEFLLAVSLQRIEHCCQLVRY